MNHLLAFARRVAFALPVLICLLLIGAVRVFAQETPQQETALLDAVTKWKILNTAIFVLALGYLIAKTAPAFFNARSADIQNAINEATGLKMQADLRYSEADRKLATLAEQVKRLRDEASAIMDRDHEKFRRETEAELEHIHHNVAAEIDALQHEAVRDIQRHTAKAALQLAERKLAGRLTGGESEEFVRDFIHLVETDKR